MNNIVFAGDMTDNSEMIRLIYNKYETTPADRHERLRTHKPNSPTH